MSGAIIKEVTGRGVPVRGNDIDTDRIIPARFLKCVTFDGLGEHAFEDDIAALAEKGETHSFRQEQYQGASILVSNSNFGCGSSREHAPQALMRWGVKAIIAESYSEIFYGNCVSLGIPSFTADHETVEKILAWIEANPEKEATLSVENATITLGDEVVKVVIPEGPQGQFLDGSWNARATLLGNMDKIQGVAKELAYLNF